MNILCMPVGPLQANCYLVWDDEFRACAVDPGGEPERIADRVRKEGLTLEAILVTHGHFDHVEGVRGLAMATGATVYCSAQVKPVLTGAEGCSATGFPVPGVDDASVSVVGDGDALQVGSLEVEVISTPGHTPGDLTFHIGGHLFPGDLLFYRSVGRTDFPGGDFAVLLTSVNRLAAAYPPETRVHPGHMQATTLGAELAHNPFLRGLDIDG
jgi:glyoxylase-like metal-dependent hydrolase (beta-lactamase superfamily II)